MIALCLNAKVNIRKSSRNPYIQLNVKYNMENKMLVSKLYHIVTLGGGKVCGIFNNATTMCNTASTSVEVKL